MPVPMAEIVEELGAALDARIAGAFVESDATEEQKEEATARYKQALRDGLRQGLATVFGSRQGKEGSATFGADKADEVPGEVTPEDLDKEYGAMLANLSRRERYPKEAAALLASTLQKNRAMLRNISVASKPEEVQPANVQMSDVNGVREALAVAGRDVKDSQEVISGVHERADQLLAAAKILARTEGALGLL